METITTTAVDVQCVECDAPARGLVGGVPFCAPHQSIYEALQANVRYGWGDPVPHGPHSRHSAF